MKEFLRIFAYAIVLLTILQISNVYAEKKEVANVSYIHQVKDMDSTKFLGHNACGPTSACMMTRFHNVQPIPGSLYNNGWYVYNSYTGFTDKSGENYSTESAMDMDSNLNHEHYVYGAHGYMITHSIVEGTDYWATDRYRLKNYLKNHGLIVSAQIISDRYDYIRKNIDAGLPLIGHSYVAGNGHYLVIIGYDTGTDGNEQNVIVNDPYGDAHDNYWNGTEGGIGVTYPLDGNVTYLIDDETTGIRSIKIDWIYTAHPVGVYFYFPGWRNEQTLSQPEEQITQLSQPFVDCYNKDRGGKSGKDIFGIPWDNGQGPWVHHWPEGSSSQDTVFLQDFIDWNNNGHWWQLVLNQELKEVFPVHGQILLFWHNNYGYLNYGEPICDEYDALDAINGHKIVIQKFKKDGDIYYLGYDTETGEAGEYTADQIMATTRLMNFEDGVDRQPIQSKIPGMVFTTTDGYDWIYGDWRMGYNGPYPDGAYYSNSNFFAWLGENQGTGRIDFIGATATYLSVLTSTYSGLTMDAYDINGTWLANSGWVTNNLNTGQMTRLTVSAPNMAYVLVHDTGNYWLIDDLEIGDLLAVAKAYLPASFIAEYEDLDTLDQDQSKWKAFFNEIYQTIKIILGWGGSELSIQIYNPDGVLYDEYQSDTPPIIIDIPDAEPGQWQFKITAIDVPENNYPFALVVGIPDATCPNTPPIADAGTDQTVAAGPDCTATVALDGSESSDSDGDPLTYTWTWNGSFANGVSPTIQLPLGTTTITLVVNDGTEDSEPDEVDITVEDTTPPATQIISPVSNQALQDGVILTADASDVCDVAEVYFYVREADGGNGSPIGYEDLPGAYNGTSWEYNFDTNTPQTPDGYYVILTKAVDTNGNEGWSTPVPVSIRNWAVIELLPNTANNKAGRTMPVKFALRIAAAVDPAQPFVYNEELEIRIYDASAPNTILQTSLYGDTSKDYRIDTAGELYITNFKTSKKPAEYVVEIWRMSKNFLVGSFTFETVK